jgi:hypothetical protein
MPMLAGVGLLVVCCSSASAAAMMMGGEEKEDPVVKTPTPKTPADADDSTQDYTESCDDLGGGILERNEGDVDLDSCKEKCLVDLDCLGFIHGEEVGFCQLHDNKDPYGVDICDKGLKVYRK